MSIAPYELLRVRISFHITIDTLPTFIFLWLTAQIQTAFRGCVQIHQLLQLIKIALNHDALDKILKIENQHATLYCAYYGPSGLRILIITLILRPPNVVCHHSNSSYVNYYFASSSLTNAKDDALFNCFQCVLYFSIPQKNENFVTIISYGYDRNQLRAKTTVILMSYLEAISFNSLFFVIHLEF